MIRQLLRRWLSSELEKLECSRVDRYILCNRFLTRDEMHAMQVGWEAGYQQVPLRTNGLRGSGWPPMPKPWPPAPDPSKWTL